MLGLEAPTAGRILVRGADRSELRSGEASVVFQNYLDSADPVWTVGDVIEEPVRLAGGRVDVRDLLRRVGLPAEYASRRPHQLSGGELQRVAIARAMARRPVARRLRRGAQQPRRLRAGRDHGASCRAQARSCRLALHLARPRGRCKALRQGRRALRRPHRRGDGRRTHGQPLERGGQALRRGRRGGAPSGVNGDVRGLRRRLRTVWTS
ncbi:MAG: ATP-binding cassette domain-containing protein [Sutterella wadsworthensis]